METEESIKAKYQKLHDNLSQSYYSGNTGLTKDAFDTQHAQIWHDMEAELIATGYTQPPVSITPPSFTPENMALGVDQRVSHIESFLKEIYPEVRQ